jgi:hypothetical protein
MQPQRLTRAEPISHAISRLGPRDVILALGIAFGADIVVRLLSPDLSIGEEAIIALVLIVAALFGSIERKWIRPGRRSLIGQRVSFLFGLAEVEGTISRLVGTPGRPQFEIVLPGGETVVESASAVTFIRSRWVDRLRLPARFR